MVSTVTILTPTTGHPVAGVVTRKRSPGQSLAGGHHTPATAATVPTARDPRRRRATTPTAGDRLGGPGVFLQM
ncbi:hypothetical protein GCM10022226_81870 [Sphaerisporangium flaviroseum]|uniref:Uncharacterized protein n=1 Tax=Sphaerisporangium flaviroseum TaxID=509199 RepID=A0ABP7JJF7_9ACTN